MVRLNRPRGISRRVAAFSAAAVLVPGQAAADDRSFRFRVQSVDSLFERVKGALGEQKIALSAYRAMLELLREEEAAISEEARAHQFRDEAESNYWHRGRLKFPSLLQTELSRQP